MTNTEKFLLLLCMSMLIISSTWDILTLYDAVCWEFIAELSVFAVSNAMCYLTITEKKKKKLDNYSKDVYNIIIK